MLEADFEFPDGDRYPIYLSEAPGGVRLSDRGDTLMRISYDQPLSIDVGGDPYRGMSLASVTGDGFADLITPNPDDLAVLVADNNRVTPWL